VHVLVQLELKVDISAFKQGSNTALSVVFGLLFQVWIMNKSIAAEYSATLNSQKLLKWLKTKKSMFCSNFSLI